MSLTAPVCTVHRTLLALAAGSVFVLAGCGAPAASTPPPAPASAPFMGADAISAPSRLVIPSIGVDAKVVPVGLAADGKMADPTNATDVAWFRPGYRPGAAGNAVIAGHLDDDRGKLVVFGRLHELRPGDAVQVTDGQGTPRTFRVTGSERYAVDRAPLERIFGPSRKAQLNLVTCDGAFDRARRMYGERLVVFTEEA